jgi:ribosome-binding factor A
MSRRTDRIEDLLRQEISDLIRRDLGDPRAHRAVVSTVEVTPNLARARIGISVMGTEEQRHETVEALQHASGYLRRQLAGRLHLRGVPELYFLLDRGAEHSARIAEILETLHDDDKAT